jgi:glutaredoxin
MKKEPILYVKDGCPWCAQAMAFFDRHGIPLDIREVRNNAENMKELIAASGQSSTPTFVYDDFIVADFSINEFLDELDQMPEVRLQLGIPDDEEDE